VLAWLPSVARTAGTVSREARIFGMDRIRRPRVLPTRTFTPDLERMRRQPDEKRASRTPDWRS
jgi:hypothetical protein